MLPCFFMFGPMPALTNHKHEQFAQELAKGTSATQAYLAAGFASANRGAASRLQRDCNVLQRVAELHAVARAVEQEATRQAAEALSIDRQWVMGKLVENVERSMQATEIQNANGGTGEYKYEGSVANRALELLGKELGMFVDRSETVNINHDISSTPLSDEQWAAQHQETSH